MKSEINSNNNILKKEAVQFSRYLLDCEPPQEMIDRYVNANRKLGTDVVISASIDEKIMEFARTHSRTIPFLDAAAGFLHPDALLRKKIYIMAAVLEASPRYTKYFLPESRTSLSLFARLVADGLTAGIKILIGIPLFLIIRSCRND